MRAFLSLVRNPGLGSERCPFVFSRGGLARNEEHPRLPSSPGQKWFSLFMVAGLTVLYGSGRLTVVHGSGWLTVVHGSGRLTVIHGSGWLTVVHGRGKLTAVHGSGRLTVVHGSGRLTVVVHDSEWLCCS